MDASIGFDAFAAAILFCSVEENYKKYSLRRVVTFESDCSLPLPSGETYMGCYHEYICPSCGTLLQVDTFCPFWAVVKRISGYPHPS